MKWQDLLSDAYGRIYQSLKMSLNGLTQEDLSQHPGEESNSMGWLAWHLTRVQDHHISALMDEDQLYLTEGWYAKFNRPAEPEDIGFGHSMETMASFTSIDAQHLVAYHKAVLDRTQSYLATLSPDDLDRELNEPRFQPLPTLGVRLISIISDNLQHAGQVAYLRGLLKGKGWMGH